MKQSRQTTRLRHGAPLGSPRLANRRRGVSRRLVILIVVVAGLGLSLGVVFLVQSWRVRWALRNPRDKARILFNMGHYDKAIRSYERALEEEPDDPELLRGIARCHLRKRDIATARDWAQRAAQHDETEQAQLLLAEIELAGVRSGKFLNQLLLASPLAPIDALASEQEGHLKRSIEHAKAALGVNADSGAAHVFLGEATAMLGDLPAGLEHAERAAALEPHSVRARLLATAILKRQGKLAKALGHCRYILDHVETNDSRPARVAAELCHELGRFDEAIELFTRLLGPPDTGGQAHIRVGLAWCHLAKGAAEAEGGEHGHAMQEYRQVVEHADRAAALIDADRVDPQQYAGGPAQYTDLQRDLHVARGSALLGLREYERAVVDLRRATSHKTTPWQVHYSLGRALRDSRQPQSARDAFLAAVGLEPCALDPREQVAKMLADEGDVAAALEQYRDAIRAHEERARLLRAKAEKAAGKPAVGAGWIMESDVAGALERMASFCEARGLDREAMEALTRLTHLPASSGAEAASRACRAAWAALRTGHAEQALRLAQHALEANPSDATVLRLLARAEAANEEYRLAARHFHEAARRDPEHLTTYLNWAAMHEAAGQTAEAEEVYRVGLRVMPASPQLRRAHGALCLKSGRQSQGIATLRGLLARDPRELSARLVLVEHYLHSGDHDAALAEAKQAVERTPRSAPALALLARAHRARGEWAKLLRTLDQAAQVAPDELVCYQRVAAYVHQKRYGLAVRIAEEALKEHPSRRATIQLDLAVAQFLATETPQERREAMALVRAVLMKDPCNCDVGFALSLMQVADGGGAAAPACRQDAVSPMAMGAWADFVALNRKRPKDAQRAARTLLEALVYDNAGWLATAAGTCEEILGFAPDALIAHQLIASLWHRAGEREKAVAAARRAVDARPRCPYSRHLLADLLLLLEGKAAEARRLYADAADRERHTSDAQLKFALMADSGADRGRAIAFWRGLFEYDPQDAVSANNLAWLLLNDPGGLAGTRAKEEAKAPAERAMSVAGDTPAVLDTAGWLHYQLGEYDEAIARFRKAIKLLEEAVAANGRAGLYRFHLGMALARKGRAREAIQELDQAVRLEPDGSFVQEARIVRARLGR